MMKSLRFLPFLAVVVVLAGCTYTYERGVTANTPPDEVATVTLSNAFHILQIDDQNFDAKFNMSTSGNTIIHLPPGPHTFYFTYSKAQGYYTQDFSALSKTLSGGMRYLICAKLERGFGRPALHFSIDDVNNVTGNCL